MNNKGQALISLLVFMVIAIAITSGAIILTISNSINTSKIAVGSDAYAIAEAGVENALLRLLRDPAYTGETLGFPNGEAVVTVVGTDPYIIRSEGTNGNFKRTIEVSVQFVNNKMEVVSWEESY